MRALERNPCLGTPLPPNMQPEVPSARRTNAVGQPRIARVPPPIHNQGRVDEERGGVFPRRWLCYWRNTPVRYRMHTGAPSSPTSGPWDSPRVPSKSGNEYPELCRRRWFLIAQSPQRRSATPSRCAASCAGLQPGSVGIACGVGRSQYGSGQVPAEPFPGTPRERAEPRLEIQDAMQPA